MVYVSYPDGLLWRANRDGSNPLQLSGPPLYPENPRWSPDGTQILLTDVNSQGPAKSYIVSSEGGTPRRLLPDDSGSELDPNWSPDGRKIVFDVSGGLNPSKEALRILDVASHQVTVVPGSAGVWSPRWSPDGKYIAGLSSGFQGLKVLDIAMRRWTPFPQNSRSDYPAWSRDSRFIYFLRQTTGDCGVYRVSIDGTKTEPVVDLRDWHITGYFSFWMGLDPADTPLFLRDIGTDDIYALSLEQK